VLLLDRQVINIDFQTLLFEFLQNVRRQSPHHAIVSQTYQNDEALVREKRPKILIPWYRTLIRAQVPECLAKTRSNCFSAGTPSALSCLYV